MLKALLVEQESGSPGKGQTLTEQILQIMEVILMEASSETPEKYKVPNEFAGCLMYLTLEQILNVIQYSILMIKNVKAKQSYFRSFLSCVETVISWWCYSTGLTVHLWDVTRECCRRSWDLFLSWPSGRNTKCWRSSIISSRIWTTTSKLLYPW